jgi:predicted Zn-dependent peptidase
VGACGSLVVAGLIGVALYNQPHLSLDELVERIERISPEETAEVAARWFDPDRRQMR